MNRLTVSLGLFGAAVAAADILSPASFATIPILRHELLCLAVLFGLVAAVGWRPTALLILWISAALAAWALYQAVPNWRPMSGPRSSAIFGSPNYLGGFAALCIFLAFLVQLKGGLFKLMVGANALSLMLSTSRGAIIAAICGLFFVVPARWRWAWLASPLIGLIVLGLHGEFGTTNRIRNLTSGLSDFMYRPLLGWGQDSPHPSIGIHYYNIAIEWLVGTGVIGFALFLWCVTETFLAARKLPDATRPAMVGLLVAYLVNGMVIFDSLGTSTVLMLALSFLVVLNADKSRAPRVVHDHQALAE